MYEKLKKIFITIAGGFSCIVAFFLLLLYRQRRNNLSDNRNAATDIAELNADNARISSELERIRTDARNAVERAEYAYSRFNDTIAEIRGSASENKENSND